MHTIDFTAYRSILCLNGNLPQRDFFSSTNLPIIAADGAANTLHDLGISPSIIIGDLDSVKNTLREKHKTLHQPHQTTNDFTKALDYMREHDLLPAIILGMNGGHLDHILNNINLFMATDNLLYDPPLSGIVISKNKIKKFNLPLNTKISLFAMPHASITTQGLKWELSKTELSFPGKNSCFNRTIQSEIEIHVDEGSALIFIYHEPMIDAGLKDG